jgi:hypothetical protein
MDFIVYVAEASLNEVREVRTFPRQRATPKHT